MTDIRTPEQAGHRLQTFARDHRPAGCRVISGDCTCPLCDVDLLLVTIMDLQAEIARLRAVLAELRYVDVLQAEQEVSRKNDIGPWSTKGHP